MTAPAAALDHATANQVDLARVCAMGRALALLLEPGMRIYLSGDLGSGKTTLVREILRTLGHPGRVASPSFTLMEPYNLSKIEVHHFDFYRLSEPEAWRDAGFEESFSSHALVLLEWPEHAGGSLPTPDLLLRLRTDTRTEPDDTRRIDFEAWSTRGQRCLNALLDGGFCVRAPSRD
jgi:tRNA threonylcarbamoyladenosine biosynthesis protein TsaE